ncbi:MAG: vitamin K epoxide reductase family protein, partial [Candidatus Cyclobacteriaceae bacterium M2_1C_046]
MEHKEGGMGSRGVSRPMAEKQMKEHHKKSKDEGGMDREMMLRMHHKQTLWVYWTIILLGLWMIMMPATFDYGKNIVEPAGGRS